MKKNKMMRAASALLVAVLLTTTVISGTFAKYTTKADGFDTARVAKFGVAVNVEAANLFANEYTGTLEGNTVVSNTTDSQGTKHDVVAPGTGGVLAKMTITGTPEVSVQVTRTASLDLEGWTDDNNNYYCPISIIVGSKELSGLNYESEAEFEAAVNAEINVTKTYAPNTTLNSTDDVVVNWYWSFENGVGTKASQDNEKDTDLGDKAAAGNAATITLDLEVVVEQVD